MKNKHLFTLGAGLALLTGCAVLTVDVDVYTGPLANTEEVQAEQVISLVMGAKPLLVQLRDYLEVTSVTRHPVETGKGAADLMRHEPSLQERLVGFRANDYYWPGHFPPASGRNPNLRNDQAIRVNEALSLYDDRAPWDFAPLLDRGALALQEYLDALHVFRPAEDASDKRLWAELSNAMTSGQAASPLGKAYEELLVPQKKVNVHQRVSANLASLLKSELAAKYEGDTSSNALFDYLAHDAKLKTHAETLFGSKADNQARSRFEQRVREISRAYLDSRRAMRGLLLVALQGHALAVEDGPGGIKFAELESTRRTIIHATSELIAACLQPLKISSEAPALQRASNPASQLGQEIQRLKTTDNKPDYERIAKLVASRLARDTGALNRSLQSLDIQLSQTSMISNRFGLARGPTAGEVDLFPSDGLRAALRKLEAAANSAFSGGRLEPGMETLIEHYLESSRTNRWFDRRSRSAEFTLLMDTLIAFGQKVVTLGNTATLLNSGSDAEIKKYVSVLQYVGNSILVTVDDLKRRAIHNERLRDAQPTARALREAGFANGLFADQAVLEKMTAKEVLEHLLESIRAQHVKALLNRPAPFVAITQISSVAANAATNTLVLTNHAALTNLDRTTTANYSTALGGVAVTTNLFLNTITNLAGSFSVASNHIVTTAGQPTAVTLSLTNSVEAGPVSDKYLAAIERVIEMKNDRIYLRPASAYLRSSYPATTLNLNESVGGGNQLERQAWRSVPVIGELLDAGGRARVKELRELDKQSWQNINRVRLHGAGNANYAVTKDDIGNWYVKSYSADPSDVIRATRNVALMAAGGTFGGKLPIVGKDGKALLATSSPLHVQYEKALAMHLATTTNTWQTLVESVKTGTFITNAMSAWAANTNITETEITSLTVAATTNKLTSKLTDAVDNATTAVNATTNRSAEEQVRTAEAQILAVLQAVKTYQAAALPGIAKAVDAADRTAVEQVFTGKIREFLEGVVQDRHRAIDRFESTVQVIQSGTGN